MKRTEYAAGILAALVVAGSLGYGVVAFSGNSTAQAPSQTPTYATDIPDSVSNAKPVAGAYHDRLDDRGYQATVYISQDGTIIVEYEGQLDDGQSVTAAYEQLAVTFATVASEQNETTTLVIAIGDIRVTAPQPLVEMRASGDIQEQAYLKALTIESDEPRTDDPD